VSFSTRDSIDSSCSNEIVTKSEPCSDVLDVSSRPGRSSVSRSGNDEVSLKFHSFHSPTNE
jgi:hypothetical protein